MEVLTVDFKAADAAEKFTYSLKETGFAVLRNHPISETLVNDVYADWRRFFADENKNEYLFDPKKMDGYFPQNVSETAKGYSVKDIKEFYSVYPWGRIPKMIGPSTLTLFSELNNVAVTLLKWVEAHTPKHISEKFSVPLSKMIEDSPRTLFRILNYPPLPEHIEPGAVRAAAHEDINLLTVLPAATDSGLQVRDAKNKWHDVPCDYGTLAVNTGDMLGMCSENYYKATAHRVINPIGEAAKRARLSMPLFLHPHHGVRLSEKHTAESFWIERMRELGLDV